MEINNTIARIQEIQRRANQLANAKIKVGFFSESKYDDNLPVAQVAQYNEYGTSKAPARPFMRTAVTNNKDKWREKAERGAAAALQGSIDAIDVANQIGFLMQADVQQSIVDVMQPALSPVTLLLRKWKNEGREINQRVVWGAIAAVKRGERASGVSTKPLQDTGTMLASVQYKVEAA